MAELNYHTLPEIKVYTIKEAIDIQKGHHDCPHNTKWNYRRLKMPDGSPYNRQEDGRAQQFLMMNLNR